MATDYTRLIDGETWAFIERTNAFYPPDASGLPIERNREIYDCMSRAFRHARPAGIAAETAAIKAPGRDIPIRIYRSAGAQEAAVLLYFHGGGFILGGLDSHDDICAELCAGTGHVVVSVDYRLAPEHIGTAAFDDAMAAFDWAAGTYGQPLVLAGDSAGGTLAACVAHHARGHRRQPAGQALIYPSLGSDMTRGSYVTHAEAPLLSVRDLDLYLDIRADGADIAGDPRYFPLADRDFSGLPPTVIFTAECDPLSSDGEFYRDAIVAAGGRAFWREERGLPHGYLRARHSVGKAREGFARIVAAVGALGRGEWDF